MELSNETLESIPARVLLAVPRQAVALVVDRDVSTLVIVQRSHAGRRVRAELIAQRRRWEEETAQAA